MVHVLRAQNLTPDPRRYFLRAHYPVRAWVLRLRHKHRVRLAVVPQARFANDRADRQGRVRLHFRLPLLLHHQTLHLGLRKGTDLERCLQNRLLRAGFDRHRRYIHLEHVIHLHLQNCLFIYHVYST